MTGDQSEGPATPTTQGDQSEGPATATTQGGQSEGPATGTTQGDQSEGPATGTGHGDQSQKPRCCRRLQFDDEPAAEPGLEDNLRNGFQEELRRSRDAARLRWNFDFEREEPLPGNWAWEKVGGPVPPAQSQEDGQPPQEESEEPEEPGGGA